jgi:hypothetical protein
VLIISIYDLNWPFLPTYQASKPRILQIESSTLHLHMTTVLAGIGFWLLALA